MTCQDNDILLNNALIQMARSFLQYVAESWPWVSTESASVESQVRVLAARQRQDVSQLAALLVRREHFIDFGSFPTEYTDQQFLSLQAMIGRMKASHQLVCSRIANTLTSLRTAGDAEGSRLLGTLESHERDILKALSETDNFFNGDNGNVANNGNTTLGGPPNTIIVGAGNQIQIVPPGSIVVP